MEDAIVDSPYELLLFAFGVSARGFGEETRFSGVGTDPATLQLYGWEEDTLSFEPSLSESAANTLQRGPILKN